MNKYNVFLVAPLAISSMLFSVVPTAAHAQTSGSACYTFTRNLGEGRAINAAEASALAQELASAGFWNVGTSITTYNDAVASAITGFQEQYAAQILTPNGLSYGTGYVGPSTRAELNALYGCAPISTTSIPDQQSFQGCPVGWTCTPPPVTYACPAGYTCTPASSSPPIQSQSQFLSINSISPAPTNLAINQTGTWIVNAADPRPNYGGVLYSANWGDGYTTSGQNIGAFSHSYTNAGAYVITFTVQEITTGITVQSSVTVNVGSTTENSVAISTDASTPATTTVQVTNTTEGQYLGLPLLVFDLNPGNTSANLKSVSVQIATQNSESQHVSAAYLYQGATPIQSAQISNGVATINDFNLSLQPNTLTPFSIKADVAGVLGAITVTTNASIVPSEVSVYDSYGNALTVSGSAQGNPFTVTP